MHYVDSDGKSHDKSKGFRYRFSPRSAAVLGSSNVSTPTPSAIPEELALVTQSGRKRGLALLVNTQLPNKINGSILNEVSEFVCFRLQAKMALDKAVEYGFDVDEVKTLPV